MDTTYQSVWTPKYQEVLDAHQESNNLYDRYTIAAWKRTPAPDPNKVVGHLPNESIAPMVQMLLGASPDEH